PSRGLRLSHTSETWLHSCDGEPHLGGRAAPFSRSEAACDGSWLTFCLAALAASALVRPAHELHGVFDMPPGFGQFDLAFCLEFDDVLGGFRNGLGAMCFQ